VLKGKGNIALDLMLPDGTRIPITETLNIGRGADNEIRLTHPSVSRHHAVISISGDEIRVKDAGSSYGTFLDSRRVDGSVAVEGAGTIQLGDVEIRIDRRREDAEEGRTIVVQPGMSVLVPSTGSSELSSTANYGFRPRVRSGWALKRLDAKEGEQRYLLRDLRAGTFVRMAPEEAALFQKLDGRTSLPDLIVEAEDRLGANGPARLARLLADLGDRGILAGSEASNTAAPGKGLFGRLMKPREFELRGADRLFDRLYRIGGYLILSQPALILLAAVALCGVVAFGLLQIQKDTAPFVVGGSIALGAAIFVLGRILIVILHELAHGLFLTGFGRRVGKAGLKLVFLIPFAFVDTSEVWFEPRRRRLAVAAAGPLCDLVAGGACAVGAVIASPASPLREALFQLALAAYLGALFNLNPFLERDGYHILVDLFRQPGLRQRGRERLVSRLAGAPVKPEPRAVAYYGIATVAWSIATLLFLILVSTRNNYRQLTAVAPPEVVRVLLACFYIAVFLPVLLFLGRPLMKRRRRHAVGVESEAV
jgi:putative peptide zinc metalloprotease protein